MSTKRETIEDFCDFIENQINVHVHHYIDDFFSTFPEEKEEEKICPKAGQCAHTPGGMVCPPNIICPI